MLDHALSAFDRACGVPGGAKGICPLVAETALAVQTMDYRKAGQRPVALAFAGEDFSVDFTVEARNNDEAFNPSLTDMQWRVAIAAAAAGVRQSIHLSPIAAAPGGGCTPKRGCRIISAFRGNCVIAAVAKSR